jgi:hypothetical protein
MASRFMDNEIVSEFEDGGRLRATPRSIRYRGSQKFVESIFGGTPHTHTPPSRAADLKHTTVLN